MTDRSLRCTVQARGLGASPAGSASSARTFVLVETPLPWPHDVGDHPLLAPLRPVLKAHRARLQALVPEATAQSVAVRRTSSSAPAGPPRPPDGAGAAAPGERERLSRPEGAEGASVDPEAPGSSVGVGQLTGPLRVIVYRQAEADVIRPYVRQERTARPDRLVEVVADLLASDPEPDADPEPGADPGPVSHGVRDVLVCTHGSRDVCCGSDGTALYQALTARDLPGVRVWRTSHTGGHRYAPTAVTFPDGRAWAWVDADLLAGIATRSVDPTEAARHDRGGAALDDPFRQAADTAVLAEQGWSWLDRPRTVEVAATNGDDRRMVTLTSAGSDPVSYGAEVAVKRVVPVPDCGRPLAEARKSSPEVEVVQLERLQDAPS